MCCACAFAVLRVSGARGQSTLSTVQKRLVLARRAAAPYAPRRLCSYSAGVESETQPVSLGLNRPQAIVRGFGSPSYRPAHPVEHR